MSDNSNLIINPLVSICCLTFNHAKYLRQCLDGFLMQQCNFKFEILIHDDASTDGTIDIIKEYEARYPDLIKPIIQKENQYSKGVRGMNATYNFPRAKGKYIALCEGDDYWIDPLKLQKQVDILKSMSNVGLVYSDVNTVDKDNNILKLNFISTSSYMEVKTFEEYLIYAPFKAPCTWLFRKDITNDLSNENSLCLDLNLLLEICSKKEIYYLDEITTFYRVLETSASHFNNPKDQYFFNKKILNIQKYHAKKSNNTHLIEKINLNYINNNFRNLIEFGDASDFKLLKKFFFQLSFKRKLIFILKKLLK